MKISNTIYDQILNVDTSNFDVLALQVFQHQSKHNPVYKNFLSLIGCEPDKIKNIASIPFMPIQVWKHNIVKTGIWDAQEIFESSGTTGQDLSKHHVRSLKWYHQVSHLCFESRYGDPSNFCWLGLLPSYLERQHSSLVSMVQHFISISKHADSGFFLDDFEKLSNILLSHSKENIPTILIGVSFGLLNFIESKCWKIDQADLSPITIIETGGMKGRREELSKPELHRRLKFGFNVRNIHSEYGMTELLSQSYSKGQGLFKPSPTMKLLVGDIADPLSAPQINRRGAVRIIDLANVDTCSFIATEDVGISYADGSFEILGRLDVGDLRGCSLMVAD